MVLKNIAERMAHLFYVRPLNVIQRMYTLWWESEVEKVTVKEEYIEIKKEGPFITYSKRVITFIDDSKMEVIERENSIIPTVKVLE